jgi:hypothetical protein
MCDLERSSEVVKVVVDGCHDVAVLVEGVQEVD